MPREVAVDILKQLKLSQVISDHIKKPCFVIFFLTYTMHFGNNILFLFKPTFCTWESPLFWKGGRGLREVALLR
jgi:hypothetical protein